MENWLEKLKVGDKVIIPGEHLCYPDSVGIVEGFTKTQITFSDSSMLCRKKDGRIIGRRYTIIKEATESRVLEIKTANKRIMMIHKVNKIHWSDFDNKTLEEVLKITGCKV